MSNENLIAIGTGMKSKYIGGFTRQEDRFLHDIYSILNSYLTCGNAPTEKLISGKDLHLFSGGSSVGTTRVDINPESKANVHMTVQEFFAKNTRKYDLIVIDPPYNLRYDKKYKTAGINTIGPNTAFIDWLTDECIAILEPDGIIVSRNWRSIAPKNCSYLAGLLSFYGGRRRTTIFDVWQKSKKPSPEIKAAFNSTLAGMGLKFVKWEYGPEGEFTPLLEHVGHTSVESTVFVTDCKEPTDDDMTPVSFNAFLASKKKFHVILIDECKGIGGSVQKTNALKVRIVEALLPGGIVAMKTYFDPVMMKDVGLVLLERQVILYKSHRTVSLLTIYQKPVNSRRQATF